MKTASYSISVMLPVSPKVLFTSWLDSKKHSAFTGSPAKISPKKAGKFFAWDGYITGSTIEMEPYRRIVQSWRTTEFPEDAKDSKLEILISESASGSKLTLNHSNVPADQVAEYKKGWKDFYFTPMKAYFSEKWSPADGSRRPQKITSAQGA